MNRLCCVQPPPPRLQAVQGRVYRARFYLVQTFEAWVHSSRKISGIRAHPVKLCSRFEPRSLALVGFAFSICEIHLHSTVLLDRQTSLKYQHSVIGNTIFMHKNSDVFILLVMTFIRFGGS